MYSTVPNVAPGEASVTTVAGPVPDKIVVVSAGYITSTTPDEATASMIEEVVAGPLPEYNVVVTAGKTY